MSPNEPRSSLQTPAQIQNTQSQSIQPQVSPYKDVGFDWRVEVAHIHVHDLNTIQPALRHPHVPVRFVASVAAQEVVGV